MKKILVSYGLVSLTLILTPLVSLAAPAEISLPLTGPAYVIADDAYKAYALGDYQLAVAKAREAIRLRPDVPRLKELLHKAETALHSPKLTISPSKPLQSSIQIAQEPARRAYHLADMAYHAYEQHNYQLAAIDARDAHQIMPDNTDYSLLLVKSLLGMGKFSEAEQAISEGLSQHGDNKDLALQYDATRHESATIPATAAYGALARGDIDNAIKYSSKAVEYAPDIPAYRLMLIEALMQGAQFDKAANIASDAIKANSEDTAALVLRAYALQRLGQRNAAIKDFNLALQKSSQQPKIQRNIRLIVIDADLAADDPQSALEVLAVLGNPDKDAKNDNPIATRRDLAQAALQHAKHSSVSMSKEFLTQQFPPPAIDCSATEKLQSCVVMPGQVAPDPGFEAAQQAYKAFNANDYDQAIEKARAALLLSPHNRRYWLLLTNATLSAGQLKNAEQAASAALAEDGNDAALLAQRGYIRQRLGKDKLAQEDFAAALQTGGLPLTLEIGLLVDSNRKQEAWHKFVDNINTDAFAKVTDLEFAYLAARVGDDNKALAAFARADQAGKLPETAYKDAAYSAVKSRHDDEAISYFKRAIDAAGTLHLKMEPQLLFETRREVATVSRTFGVIGSIGNNSLGTIAGPGSAPGASGSNIVQAGMEAYWRPFGYQNGQTVEVFGRLFETLNDRDGTTTGAPTLQAVVGARWKPLTDQNLVLSFGRLVPIGTLSTGDWLAQVAYSAGKGTDLRVDVPSWWTAQWYGEVDRYFQHPQTHGIISTQVGRSFRLDGIDPKLVLFPNLAVNVDYNTFNYDRTAIGAGPGVNLRYWFREDIYTAPMSFFDLSMQYRFKIDGDDRARGLFLSTTVSY